MDLLKNVIILAKNGRLDILDRHMATVDKYTSKDELLKVLLVKLENL